MSPFNIVEEFEKIIDTSASISASVAAIKALKSFICNNNAGTMLEITQEFDEQIRILLVHTQNSASIMSGCELFSRFVSLMASDETMKLESFKEKLIKNTDLFIDKEPLFRKSIAEVFVPFIREGSVILIHSHSKSVMEVIRLTKERNIRFKVYVTEAIPSHQGIRVSKEMTSMGVIHEVIPDASVAYFMNKVDMVVTGAEGVVENGGIINQIGTYQVSIIAQAFNKPFYVLVEIHKFIRYYPTDQSDLPSYTSSANYDRYADTPKYTASPDKEHPQVDYTPPSGITLLITNMGILTPSGVSDELIKFYY